MLTVRLTVDGAEAAAERLTELGARLTDPELERQVLAARAADMVTAFQENITTGGARLADRGISWPDLQPATRAIRRYYGHGGKGKLIRGGDLLRSIQTLAEGPGFVEVGSAHHAAAAVHHGGPHTDHTGTRTVGAFPFIQPSRQDVDDWVELIAEELFDVREA